MKPSISHVCLLSLGLLAGAASYAQSNAMPGAAPDGQPWPGASVVIPVGSTTEAALEIINGTAFADRDYLVGSANTRVELALADLFRFEQQAGSLTAETRPAYTAALASLQTSEKTLRNSIKRIKNASERNWTDRRAKLATDYRTFADNLAQVSATAMPRA